MNRTDLARGSVRGRHFAVLIAASALTAACASVFYIKAADPAPQPAPAQPGTDTDTAKGLALRGNDLEPVGNRWAMLIGVNHYDNIPSLECCANDMLELANVLIERCGYDADRVRLMCDKPLAEKFKQQYPKLQVSDALRGNIVVQLDTILKNVGANDSVLFYFSGHGAPDGNGNTYLLCGDGSYQTVELTIDTGLAMSKVYQALQKCPAKQKIVILDSCHAAGKDGAAKGDPDAPGSAFTDRPPPPPLGKGLVELLSCDHGQSSRELKKIDGMKDHGLFTYHVLEALKGKADREVNGVRDGIVTAEEVYQYAYNGVLKYFHDNGTPPSQTPVQRGERIGDVSLARVGTVKTPDGIASEKLETAFILSSLKARHKAQKVSKDLHESAERWLVGTGEDTSTLDLRMLLALLNDGAMTQEQFLRVSRPIKNRVESAQEARARMTATRTYAVHIGIDDYDAEFEVEGKKTRSRLSRLKYAASDAQLIGTTLRATRPNCIQKTLTNSEATREAIVHAIKEQATRCQEPDLLLITFSGIGGPAEIPIIPDESAVHRGLRPAELPTRADPALSGRDRSKSIWLVHQSKKKELPYEPLPIEAVLDAIDDYPVFCKGHVLILSDTCEVFPSRWWPLQESTDVTQRLGVTEKSSAPQRELYGAPRARVFVGFAGQTRELEKLGAGVLTFLVTKAMLGQADSISPRPLDQRRLLESSEPMITSPDGFVTLNELIAFLRAVNLNSAMEEGTENRAQLVVRGRLSDEPVVLGRSTLPLD